MVKYDFESRHSGEPAMWFTNMFDTNQAVQAQKMAISLSLDLESRGSLSV